MSSKELLEKWSCQKCNGKLHELSRGAVTTLYMKGNVLFCDTSHEQNMTQISYCPYCRRNISAMGGFKEIDIGMEVKNGSKTYSSRRRSKTSD